MITFDVIGAPAPQGSKVAGVSKTGRRFVRESSKSLPGWRQLVMDQAQRHAPRHPFEGPIRLDVEFRLPVPKSMTKRDRLARVSHTKKPDRTKLLRGVEDAMRGVFWRDDSQVVAGDTIKAYAFDGPIGCTITVTAPENTTEVAI